MKPRSGGRAAASADLRSVEWQERWQRAIARTAQADDRSYPQAHRKPEESCVAGVRASTAGTGEPEAAAAGRSRRGHPAVANPPGPIPPHAVTGAATRYGEREQVKQHHIVDPGVEGDWDAVSRGGDEAPGRRVTLPRWRPRRTGRGALRCWSRCIDPGQAGNSAGSLPGGHNSPGRADRGR